MPIHKGKNKQNSNGESFKINSRRGHGVRGRSNRGRAVIGRVVRESAEIIQTTTKPKPDKE